MNGNPEIVWLCLVAGILLQLSYMMLPFQPWDWGRYLGAALIPVIVLAVAYHKSHAIKPGDGLVICGMFAGLFALFFQARILPRLTEGVVLIWTLVLLYVILDLGVWRAALPYIIAGAVAVVLVLMLMNELPYVLKLIVYAWFLAAIVALGTLQFRGSDFSRIIAGRADTVNYAFAFIDGMAGAYIAVHAMFLYELLPIPGKGEAWTDFKARWLGYLDLVTQRVDAQRMSTLAALGLLVGVVLLAALNRVFNVLPARTFANLILIGVPIGWTAAFGGRTQAGHKTVSVRSDGRSVVR